MQAESLQTVFHAHVLEFASQGFAVFPCVPGEKRPLVAGGLNSATKSPAQIASWWSKNPGANVAIATGPASGVFVVDIDQGSGKDGEASLAALEQHYGELPRTLSVRTQGGGRHLYFVYPEGRTIRNSASSIAPHIDVRGEGGYVLAPPSVGPTGSAYTWIDPDVPVAPAPAWLLSLLDKPRTTAPPVTGLGIIVHGARNDTLFREACRLRARGLDVEQIAEQVREMNAERCRPPLDDAEVESIVRSAERYPLGAAADTADPDEQRLLEELSALSDMEYGRIRKRIANREDVNVATIDKLRKRATKTRDTAEQAGQSIRLRTDIPHSEPVALDTLLDEISATISQYVICGQETADACALWIAFTWVVDHFPICPLALITAPEKRCGKSTLLGVMGRLVRKPLLASNITPSAMFRSLELCRPTLLIDEADTFLGNSDELRGIINSGHTRDSAHVIRTVGDDHEPRQFCTWGPKAISMIKLPADTIVDRSIVLSLRRKQVHETVARLSLLDDAGFSDTRSNLARMAEDFPPPGPDLPLVDLPGLNDRARDNWVPLLNIAERAGQGWLARAVRAATTLNADGGDLPTASIELLTDIRDLFVGRGVTRLRSSDLANWLRCMEDRPWGTYNRGAAMTAYHVARLLKPFGVRPTAYKDESNTAVKGYRLEDLEETFARYLPGVDATPASVPTADESPAGATRAETDSLTAPAEEAGS